MFKDWKTKIEAGLETVQKDLVQFSATTKDRLQRSSFNIKSKETSMSTISGGNKTKVFNEAFEAATVFQQSIADNVCIGPSEKGKGSTIISTAKLDDPSAVISTPSQMKPSTTTRDTLQSSLIHHNTLRSHFASLLSSYELLLAERVHLEEVLCNSLPLLEGLDDIESVGMTLGEFTKRLEVSQREVQRLAGLVEELQPGGSKSKEQALVQTASSIGSQDIIMIPKQKFDDFMSNYDQSEDSSVKLSWERPENPQQALEIGQTFDNAGTGDERTLFIELVPAVSSTDIEKTSTLFKAQSETSLTDHPNNIKFEVELKELTNTLGHLRSEIKTKDIELAKLRQESVQSAHEISSLKSQLTTLNLHATNLEKKMGSLESKVALMEPANSKLSDHVSTLEASKQEASMTLSNAESRNKQLETLLEARDGDLMAAGKTVDKLRDEIASMKSELTTVGDMTSQYKGRAELLEEELNREQRLNSEREVEFDYLRTEKRDLEKKMLEEKKRASLEHQDLLTKIAETSADVERLRKALKVAESKSAGIGVDKDLLAKIKAELDQSEARNASLSASLREYKTLEKELMALRTTHLRCASSASQITHLETQLNTLSATITTLTTENRKKDTSLIYARNIILKFLQMPSQRVSLTKVLATIFEFDGHEIQSFIL